MKLVTVVLSCIAVWSSTVSAQDRLPTRTLNELLSRSEAAVIGAPAEVATEASPAGVSKAPFTTMRLIKDDDSVDQDAVVLAKCRLRDLSGDRFLLLRSKDRDGTLRWMVKQALSDETVQHLVVLSKTEFRGVERLKFFYDFLEHSDPIISGNADLEFLLASDETFASFGRRLEAAQIRERLVQEKLPVHRRRLYLAMLAKCGAASDAGWIERQLEKPDDKSGTLDAYLAAYLALKGEAGLEFLEERYLTGANVDFWLTYSAILALRFASDHPELGIAAHRLRQSHRLVLDNPQLLDIAIHSLALVKDWSSMDRIVDLGKASEDPTIHMATINFLRRCPGENANQNLREMARRYPKVFQRSITFFPDSALKTNGESKAASIRWTGRPAGC